LLNPSRAVEIDSAYCPPLFCFLEVVFVRKHSMVFEYMRYLKGGWFGKWHRRALPSSLLKQEE
jgi:hypothetical protein